MISIVLSKSVDKSNTKYYDVVIKWVNISTLIISIDKTYTLYRDVVIKWLNVVTLTVNIDKRSKCYYVNSEIDRKMCFVLWCSDKVILYYYFVSLPVTIPNNYYF